VKHCNNPIFELRLRVAVLWEERTVAKAFGILELKGSHLNNFVIFTPIEVFRNMENSELER
ncbi:unnamed protein product, partial [Allacma fusca]